VSESLAPLISSALAAWQANRLDEARALLNEAADEAPDNGRVWELLARLCLWQGDAEAAGLFSAESLALDPGNPDFRILAEEIRWRAGRPAEALAGLSGLCENNDAVAVAAAILGDLPPTFECQPDAGLTSLLKRAARKIATDGNPSAAGDWFQWLAQRHPDDPNIHCDLLAATVQVITDAINLGRLLPISDIVRLRLAILSFRTARRLAPGQANLWRNLGTLLATLAPRTAWRTDIKAAEAHCVARWLNIEQESAQARSAVADIFYSSRNLTGAAEVLFGRLIPCGAGWDEEPLDSFLERLDQALKTVETNLEAPPSADRASETGIILTEIGFTQESVTALVLAANSAPDSPSHRERLAEIMTRNRLLEEAAAHFTGRPTAPLQPLVLPPRVTPPA